MPVLSLELKEEMARYALPPLVGGMVIYGITRVYSASLMSLPPIGLTAMLISVSYAILSYDPPPNEQSIERFKAKVTGRILGGLAVGALFALFVMAVGMKALQRTGSPW